MLDIATLGYAIDSSQAVSAGKALDAMSGAAMRADKTADALEAQVKRTGGALSQMGQRARGVQAQIDGMFGKPGVARDRAADIQHYAAEMDALRAKFNPLFAASQQYEASLAEITRAEKLGAISAMEAAAARERAAAALRPATTQMVGFNGAVQAGTGYTANLAAQFNDIGIMLAAGQSPFQLAMQQGTQVSQVLNQMGGGVGALRALQAGFMSMVNPISLATVGIIGFGAAAAQWLMSGTEGAREFDDVMGDVWESVSKVNDMVSVYSIDGIGELQKKYGELNASVVEFINLQTQAAQLEAMRKQQELIASMTDDMHTFTRTVEQSLARAFGKSVDEVGRLEYLLRQVQRARTFDEMQAALTAARAEALRLSGGLENAHGEGKTLLMRLIESEDAARQLATAAPKANWLNAAISGAQSLVDTLWEAVRAKAAVTAEGMVDAAGNPTQFGLDSGARRGPRRAPASPELTGSAPGGGGGGSDPFKERLKSLVEGIQTERVTLETWYAESEAMLNDKRAKEILGEQAHKEAMLNLEREYQERKKALDVGYQGNALQQAGQFFGDMANAMQGGNEKMLKISQVFAAAQGLINSYLAYTEVLKDPSLPWFARIPAAVGVLSAGLKMVSAIKGVSAGGGKASAGASGAGTSAAGPAAAPTRRVIVDLVGPDWMKQMATEMLDTIYKESKDGAVITVSK